MHYLFKESLYSVCLTATERRTSSSRGKEPPVQQTRCPALPVQPCSKPPSMRCLVSCGSAVNLPPSRPPWRDCLPMSDVTFTGQREPDWLETAAVDRSSKFVANTSWKSSSHALCDGVTRTLSKSSSANSDECPRKEDGYESHDSLLFI